MKKALCMILALLTCLAACTALVACGHEHQFSEEWNKDTTHHWHDCADEDCEEQSEKAEHDWDEGTVTLHPTASTDGVLKYTCKVCGAGKTESIPADPTATEAEWAEAFLMQDENFVMTIVRGNKNLIVKKRGGIVMTTDPQTVNLSQNYYVVESGKYYCYTVDGEQVTKAEITQQAYQSATTLVDLQALAYGDFTYSSSGLSYTAASITVDGVTYENVHIAFAAKKITNISFTRKEAGKPNEEFVITVTYGTVSSNLVLPQVTG